VILLDTHIRVWLVSEAQHFRPRQRELLDEAEAAATRFCSPGVGDPWAAVLRASPP